MICINHIILDLIKFIRGKLLIRPLGGFRSTILKRAVQLA